MPTSEYQIRDIPELSPASFWHFSLKFYERQGVKDACLMLQNKYHGNVNLLLMMCWLDAHQYSFEADELKNITQTLIKHQSLLVEFRRLRKQSKSHLPTSLYQDMLQYELSLEKQQQYELVSLIKALPLAREQDISMTQIYCTNLNATNLIPMFQRAILAHIQ